MSTGVLVAHPGTQYAPRLAEELASRQLLASFITGFAVPSDGWLRTFIQILGGPVQHRLKNRFLTGVPNTLVRNYPVGEFIALTRQRFGGESQVVLHERNANFQQAIPDSLLRGASAVVGFDTSGWILAARCAAFGIPFLLDQSIGHPDSKAAVYEMLRRRYPNWSHDAEERLPRVRLAEETEHKLAQRIVVASTFSHKTLHTHGISTSKVVMIPYGVDCSRFVVKRHRGSRPFRFVFVGSMTVRKGVAQLLDVWRHHRPPGAELWLIGPVTPRIAPLLDGHTAVKYLGGLPNSELTPMLSQCDVFVFPSFFEGFGLVILEAMACGLPVITTTATAGPDIIDHGREGWIVEPGDDHRLATLMRTCTSDPEGVAMAGSYARQKAEEFTWARYGNSWADLLNGISACNRDLPQRSTSNGAPLRDIPRHPI